MGEPRNARVAGVALAVGLAIAVASSALAGPGDTKLVSRQSKSAGGLGGDDPSRAPALSANGRYVAFQTEAGNLGGPIAGPVNIYVYDRKRKRVELVSRQSRSDGGGGADGGSYQPSISGSGRYVAFRSDADNLGSPIAANSNIYVYDRERNKVQLVSRRSRSGGGAGANGNSEDPVISANGRIVAFQTLATNLQGPLNTSINTYVYDLERKRVELVSRQSKSHGGEGQDDAYFDDYPASLSATGRDQRDLLPGIAVPALLVWGAEDVRSPVATVARQFEEAIPGAELVVIPAAGHMANLERPVEFNAAVRDFCLAHPLSYCKAKSAALHGKQYLLSDPAALGASDRRPQTRAP